MDFSPCPLRCCNSRSSPLPVEYMVFSCVCHHVALRTGDYYPFGLVLQHLFHCRHTQLPDPSAAFASILLCAQFIRCLPAAFSREPFLTSSTSASSLSSGDAHVWLPRFLPRLFAQFCLTTSRRLQRPISHMDAKTSSIPLLLRATVAKSMKAFHISNASVFLTDPLFPKLYLCTSRSQFLLSASILPVASSVSSTSDDHVVCRNAPRKKKGGEREKYMRLNEADKYRGKHGRTTLSGEGPSDRFHHILQSNTDVKKHEQCVSLAKERNM